MTSFLLVSTRPEEEAIEAEYSAFLTASGLKEAELEQVRLDMLGLPEIDVRAYSGIIIAGSPFGTTTLDDFKTPSQCRVESELRHLLEEILKAGVPCLTSGYATEIATVLLGGKVSTEWAEGSQLVEILLTADGIADPLLEDFPRTFPTFVNHREAVSSLPSGAIVLAKSITCPVQIMKCADNFYATQFNPELDSDVISDALQRWEDAGYPGTDDVDYLVVVGRKGAGCHQAGKVVANFVKRYRSAS